MTLCLLGMDLADDVSPDVTFNDSLTAFLKKGNLDKDIKEVLRAPEATRPLGLRNSDVLACLRLAAVAGVVPGGRVW